MILSLIEACLTRVMPRAIILKCFFFHKHLKIDICFYSSSRSFIKVLTVTTPMCRIRKLNKT